MPSLLFKRRAEGLDFSQRSVDAVQRLQNLGHQFITSLAQRFGELLQVLIVSSVLAKVFSSVLGRLADDADRFVDIFHRCLSLAADFLELVARGSKLRSVD